MRPGTALLAEQHDVWLTLNLNKRYVPQSSTTRRLGGIAGTNLSDLLEGCVAV